MRKLMGLINRLAKEFWQIRPSQKMDVPAADIYRAENNLTEILPRRTRANSKYNLLDLQRIIDLAG